METKKKWGQEYRLVECKKNESNGGCDNTLRDGTVKVRASWVYFIFLGMQPHSPFSSPTLSLLHRPSSWIIKSLNTKGHSQPPTVLENGDNCLICYNCRALPCLVKLIAFEIHLVLELYCAKCYSRSGETSASKWNWLWKQTELQPVEWPYVFSL